MRLDNEAREEHLSLLEKQELAVQLVPLWNYKNNLAERAIQAYKNHLMSRTSTDDIYFPMALWYILIPQVKITINLLRNSRKNPNLLAHAQIFGQFYYDKTLLVLPGYKFIAHETLSSRKYGHSTAQKPNAQSNP